MKTFFMYTFFIIACVACGYAFFLSLKYNKQYTQLRVLSRRNSELLSKLKTFNTPLENLIISYLPVYSYHGEIKNSTLLYIAPLLNSAIVRNVSQRTKVQIIDCCEVYNIIWYEVKVIIQSQNKNIKGFVMKSDVKELEIVETGLYTYKNIE